MGNGGDDADGQLAIRLFGNVPSAKMEPTDYGLALRVG